MRLVALLALFAAALTAADFYVKDGDRVVFFGDSITDQRLYTTYVETYCVTRFPGRKMTFVHSGWGGDRVSGGAGGPIDVRLERDVFAYKPTVLTIMLGMNDGGYKPFDQTTFENFVNGYISIVRTAKAKLPGLRVTAIQPSPYDDVTQPPKFEGGYNAVLRKFGDFLREFGSTEQIFVADMNTPVVENLRKAVAIDPAGAQKIIPDRVHPGPAGHLLMAAALLKAWNAPSLVSDVFIDFKEGRVVRSTNARISVFEPENLSWTQVDYALPMPVKAGAFNPNDDAAMTLALQSSDFVEALNREMLFVKGLDAGKYTLKIDGAPIGDFSDADLIAGINLAAFPTPMMKQAEQVHALTAKHTGVHNTRWRQLQVPLQTDNAQKLPAALDALDALENELVKMQQDAAEPRPRRYELIRAQ